MKRLVSVLALLALICSFVAGTYVFGNEFIGAAGPVSEAAADAGVAGPVSEAAADAGVAGPVLEAAANAGVAGPGQDDTAGEDSAEAQADSEAAQDIKESQQADSAAAEETITVTSAQEDLTKAKTQDSAKADKKATSQDAGRADKKATTQDAGQADKKATSQAEAQTKAQAETQASAQAEQQAAAQPGTQVPAQPTAQAEVPAQPGTQAPAQPTAQDQAPSNAQAAQATPANQAPAVDVFPGVIFIGDSRCVQMQAAVDGGGCMWICKNSMGYDWFESYAVGQADPRVGRGTKVVICLGVNDTDHVNQYAALTNQKAAEWAQRGAKTYYVSVNPVSTNPYRTEDEVEQFNTTLPGLLSGVTWIDTHSALAGTGLHIVDGLHYDDNSYLTIFNLIMGSL